MNDDAKLKPGDLYSRGGLSFVMIIATRINSYYPNDDGGNIVVTLDTIDGLQTVLNVRSVAMLIKYGGWKPVEIL